MPNYFTPTVVTPDIPVAAFSPLEHLILRAILDSEESAGGLYLFSSEGVNTYPTLPREPLLAALAASQGFESELNAHVAAEFAADPGTDEPGFISIDLNGIDYCTILQDVLRRAPSLAYITVQETATVSRMCREGWGGTVILVTRDEIVGKSTADILEDLLDDAGLTGIDPVRPAEDAAEPTPVSEVAP